MDLAPEAKSFQPAEFWTHDNVPRPAREDTGPAGYQDQWKALWKVTG